MVNLAPSERPERPVRPACYTGATGPTQLTGPQGPAGAAGPRDRPVPPPFAPRPTAQRARQVWQGPPGPRDLPALSDPPAQPELPGRPAAAPRTRWPAWQWAPLDPGARPGWAKPPPAKGRINNNFSYVLLAGAQNITIADNETRTNLQVDNVNFQPNILLPHSATIGAGVVISISVHEWSAGANVILVGTQTGDQLLLPAEEHINPTGVITPGTFWSLNYSCEVLSDGHGHWYFLSNN